MASSNCIKPRIENKRPIRMKPPDQIKVKMRPQPLGSSGLLNFRLFICDFTSFTYSYYQNTPPNSKRRKTRVFGFFFYTLNIL